MSLLEFDCRLRYPSGFLVEANFKTSVAITSLFGPSGSGKTSILSMIAGLRRPESGTIRLAGNILFDSAKNISLKPEERHIGYVFQEQLLFPHLSARRNLLYGWRRRAAAHRAIPFDRVVQVLELQPLLSRLPATLSGGERQRVALGRALLSAPQMILLDEPLTGLDDGLKQRVLEYVERILNEWRVPTLYVTHNADEVKRLAGWVIALRAGRVEAAGQPLEILERLANGER